MPMTEDWFVPGGAVIADGVGKLRLRPPPDWQRVILELKRTPPSKNNNAIRSHWRGYHDVKKDWQAEIGLLLMAARAPRGHYQRALAGAFVRFKDRNVRDPGNFADIINKALGDALVIATDMPRRLRYIPDDDERHYYFGGVEFEEPGEPRTRIFLYFQPKED